MKIKVVLFRSLLIVTTILVLCFGIWYGNSFHRHLDSLNASLIKSQNTLRKDVGNLYKLAIAAESKEGLARWAARQAYYELSYRYNKKSNTVWVLNGLLWYWAIKTHFDEKGIFYIWCNYSIFTGNWGINEAALKYYGKPIMELSLEEQAAIVAMVKSSSVYKIGKERSKQRIKWILERYKSL